MYFDNGFHYQDWYVRKYGLSFSVRSEISRFPMYAYCCRSGMSRTSVLTVGELCPKAF